MTFYENQILCFYPNTCHIYFLKNYIPKTPDGNRKSKFYCPTLLFPTIAIATESFLFIPPDRLLALLSRASISSSDAITSSILAFTSLEGTPFNYITNLSKLLSNSTNSAFTNSHWMRAPSESLIFICMLVWENLPKKANIPSRAHFWEILDLVLIYLRLSLLWTATFWFMRKISFTL